MTSHPNGMIRFVDVKDSYPDMKSLTEAECSKFMDEKEEGDLAKAIALFPDRLHEFYGMAYFEDGFKKLNAEFINMLQNIHRNLDRF